jgi:hypothetical protein
MTEKQRRWQERNRILWRLKGMYIVTASSNNILTATESEKISQAMSLIRDVVDNSTQSSRQLGFNAVERCRICGKPAYKNGLCKKCNESMGY